jgi:hypothetical protein
MSLLNFQSFVIMFKLNKEGWKVESNTNWEDQHKVHDSNIMPLVLFSMHSNPLMQVVMHKCIWRTKFGGPKFQTQLM